MPIRWLAALLCLGFLSACGDITEPAETPDDLDNSPKMQNAIYILDSFVNEDGFVWDPVGKIDLVIENGTIDGQLSGCYKFQAKIEVNDSNRTFVVSDFMPNKSVDDFAQCEKNYNFSMRPGNTGKITFEYLKTNSKLVLTKPNVPMRDWKATFRLVRRI